MDTNNETDNEQDKGTDIRTNNVYSGLTKARSEGIAGPSRDASGTDATAPAADVTGPENEELAWAKRHIKEPVLIERKTELSGHGVQPKHKPQRKPVAERVEALAADLPPGALENHGELVFQIFSHLDRIADRQDRKIERLIRKVAELEQRRQL